MTRHTLRSLNMLCLLVILGISSISAQKSCGTEEYLQNKLQNDQKFAKHYYSLVNMDKISAEERSSLACSNTVIIPIAVHFNDPITCENATCLLDAVEAQIVALNADFQASNSDYERYEDLNAVCPTAYPMSTAPTKNEGTCVQFCLARKNHPPVSGLSDGDPAITVGSNDWPSAPDWEGYLNIFVSNSQGGLGLSVFPGSADGDGFWVKHTSFGGPDHSCVSGGNINTSSAYNLGRTTTHEAGHYLGLPHVFGSCSNDPDSNPPGPISINDTPNQNDPLFGNPSVGSCDEAPTSCSGEPNSFFSFMDYTDDAGMVIFTADQSAVISWHANDINFHSDVTHCEGSYGPVVCPEEASCVDDMINQDEQDVDCGGVNCGDCARWCGLSFFDEGGPLGAYSNNNSYEWTFCPDQPFETITVTFTEWDVEDHNTCAWDVMRIYDGPDTESPQIGNGYCTNNPGTVTASLPGDCLTFTFDSDISVTEAGWKATINCLLALPVELASFSGHLENNKIRLEWITTQEIQNKGFEIQRSVDSKDFATIGFVEGQINSETRQSYSFEDSDFEAATVYYYRLKQLDLNGAFEYSDIVSVKTPKQKEKQIKTFPNPVQNNLTISITGYPEAAYVAEFYSLQGELVYSQQLSNETTVNLSQLSTGLYVVKLKSGTEILNIDKIVKL